MKNLKNHLFCSSWIIFGSFFFRHCLTFSRSSSVGRREKIFAFALLSYAAACGTDALQTARRPRARRLAVPSGWSWLLGQVKDPVLARDVDTRLAKTVSSLTRVADASRSGLGFDYVCRGYGQGWAGIENRPRGVKKFVPKFQQSTIVPKQGFFKISKQMKNKMPGRMYLTTGIR